MKIKYSHIFFDLDGVLVDSEARTFQLLQTICKEHNILLPNSFIAQRIGKKISQFILEISHIIPISKAQIISSMFYEEYEKNPKNYYSPIKSTLTFIKKYKNQYTFVLTSMSSLKTIKSILERLDLNCIFSHIFSCESVKKPKPNPEIYIRAVEKLQISKNKAAVIEDSLLGIQASLSAKLDTFVFCGNRYSDNLFKDVSGKIYTLQDYEHYFGSRS